MKMDDETDQIDLEDTLDLSEVSETINSQNNYFEGIGLHDDDLLKFQVSALEAAYVKSHGLEIGTPEGNQLFPFGWFSEEDSLIKMKALAEAIDKDILVVDTPSYQSIIEGVRRY